MKLHTYRRILTVLDGHDFAGLRPRGHSERVGRFVDNQGMIPRDVYGRWKAGEDTGAVMHHGRDLSVHGLGRPDNSTAKRFAYALVPEADAEYGDRWGELPDDVSRYACLAWCTRAR